MNLNYDTIDSQQQNLKSSKDRSPEEREKRRKRREERRALKNMTEEEKILAREKELENAIKAQKDK